MVTKCSHFVHQVKDLKKANQYEIALAVISSLMADCEHEQEVIKTITSVIPDAEYSDSYAQGCNAAYRSIVCSLQAWKEALLKQ